MNVRVFICYLFICMAAKGESLMKEALYEGALSLDVQARYLQYLPEGYGDGGKQWPLVLMLHGAGERGADLNQLKGNGLVYEVEQGRAFPFVLVAPQCPAEDWWSSQQQVASLKALLDHLLETNQIDRSRVYLTGLSMGGTGAWRLAMEFPEYFAALLPICGRGDASRYWATRIKHIPIWAFHGDADDIVPVETTRSLMESLRAVGAEPKYTEYPGVNHNAWSATYSNPEVIEWMLNQRRD